MEIANLARSAILGVPPDPLKKPSPGGTVDAFVETERELAALWDRTKGGWAFATDTDPDAGSGGDDTASYTAAAQAGAPFFIDRPLKIAAKAVINSAASKRIFGDGTQRSTVTITTAGQGAIEKTGGGGLDVDGIKFSTAVDQNAGTVIKSTDSGLTKVRNCQFAGKDASTRLYRIMDLNGVIPQVEKNYCLLWKNIAIHLQNTQESAGGSEANVTLNTLNAGIIGANGSQGMYWATGNGPLQAKQNRFQNLDYVLNAPFESGFTGGLDFSSNVVSSTNITSLNLVLASGSDAILSNLMIGINTFDQPNGSKVLVVTKAGSGSDNWVQRMKFFGNLCVVTEDDVVLINSGVAATLMGNDWYGSNPAKVPVKIGSAVLYGRMSDNFKLNITTLSNDLSGRAGWTVAA